MSRVETSDTLPLSAAFGMLSLLPFETESGFAGLSFVTIEAGRVSNGRNKGCFSDDVSSSLGWPDHANVKLEGAGKEEEGSLEDGSEDPELSDCVTLDNLLAWDGLIKDVLEASLVQLSYFI